MPFIGTDISIFYHRRDKKAAPPAPQGATGAAKENGLILLVSWNGNAYGNDEVMHGRSNQSPSGMTLVA